MNRIDPFGMDYWTTSDPEQIRRFINDYKAGTVSTNTYESWAHISDEALLKFKGNGKLTYNDETKTFYSSSAEVRNGEWIVTGKSWKVKQNNKVWDYISAGSSVASVPFTIKSAWTYNTFGGDVKWTGKNGNYYKLSQVKNNGGYVRSMNYAKNASRLTRGLGNGLTYISIGATTVSTVNALRTGTDNTSTWVGATIGVGTGVLTLVAAPAVITGATIVGGVWGISQLVAGDEINGWIDNNFGYR